MKINKSPKQKFQLNRTFRFKGSQKSLTIREGTIGKLRQKSKYGTFKVKKKDTGPVFKRVTKKAKQTIHGKNQTTISNNKSPIINQNHNKKGIQKNKKKQTTIQKRKSASSFAARAGTKTFLDIGLNTLNQEEDLEGLRQLKGTVSKNRRVVKETKRMYGFATKNQKFSKSVSNGKIESLRFDNQPLSSPTSKIKQLPKKNKIRKSKRISRNLMNTFKQSVSKVAKTATTKTPWGWLVLIVVFFLMLFFGLTLMAGNQSTSASSTGSIYVEHWDGPDAYHSSLLAQRYGITAEQIDGFIKNEGYAQVDERATGKEFLRLQSISGIDVRMLVAFAQMESSFGTAGVAKQFPKANIFGYGAFDNDPNQGASWDNTRAVNEFRSTQIDSYGNRTIAIMDERARNYHNNTLKPGEYVYWTSLDAGKARAEIAEKLDKWIDDHGGTPEPPGGYGTVGGGGVGLTVLDKMLGQTVSGDFGGETGQCYAVTAYYAHSINSEIILKNGIAASNIGTDYNWKAWGWTVVSNPNYRDIQAGDIINFKAGANMGTWVADGLYGHTGVVGKVLGNNQFILYDQNPGPLKTWLVTYVPGGISSVIHPPK